MKGKKRPAVMSRNPHITEITAGTDPGRKRQERLKQEVSAIGELLNRLPDDRQKRFEQEIFIQKS
jgi:hypothetical protein